MLVFAPGERPGTITAAGACAQPEALHWRNRTAFLQWRPISPDRLFIARQIIRPGIDDPAHPILAILLDKGDDPAQLPGWRPNPNQEVYEANIVP